MAFKTINKLFKGQLIQVCPCKGYGYISPAWNKEALSSKNLYCYYASTTEKARKKCFLKIFEKGGKYFPHEVIKNYKNEEIWIPENPQIIYFEVEIEGPNYRCVHLFDERHLSVEEKAEAELASAEEPDFEALLKEQEAFVEDYESVLKEQADLLEAALMEEASAEEPAPIEEAVAEVTVATEVAAAEAFVEETPAKEENSYDAYQDGQNCGEDDYKEFHKNLLEQYKLEDLSWEDRKEFERGYENGFSSAQEEEIEEKVQDCCFSYEDEEVKQKTSKPKNKENNSSKATEKEASKNRKAQKKAEEEAFEAAFSDSDC